MQDDALCCLEAIELTYTREQFDQAVGITQIARDTKLTRQTIYRIKDDPAGSGPRCRLGGRNAPLWAGGRDFQRPGPAFRGSSASTSVSTSPQALHRKLRISG